jgi:hypothetical protein
VHHLDCVGVPQLVRREPTYEKLAIAGGEGVTLVIYHAEPESSSAHSLQLLGSMAAPSAGRREGWPSRS